MAEVDVIMPVYRGRRWIPSTIRSLQNQTFTDWRLIVVDDACPERTGELVWRLLPEALVVFSEKNMRAAAARNTAVQYSTAPFLALFDQDDLWHPTKLARQVASLRNRPSAGASHTDAMIVDKEGRLLGEADTNARRRLDWDHAPIRELLRAQFVANRVKTASSVIRRDVWDAVGGMQTGRHGGEDWALWVNVLAGGWRLAHIAEPLFYWRQHDANTSSSSERSAGFVATRRRYAIRYAHLLGPRLLAKMLLRRRWTNTL